MTYTITINHQELQQGFCELNQIKGFLSAHCEQDPHLKNYLSEAFPFFTELVQHINQLAAQQRPEMKGA